MITAISGPEIIQNLNPFIRSELMAAFELEHHFKKCKESSVGSSFTGFVLKGNPPGRRKVMFDD